MQLNVHRSVGLGPKGGRGLDREYSWERDDCYAEAVDGVLMPISVSSSLKPLKPLSKRVSGCRSEAVVKHIGCNASGHAC